MIILKDKLLKRLNPLIDWLIVHFDSVIHLALFKTDDYHSPAPNQYGEVGLVQSQET